MIKTPKQPQWCRSDIFIVNSEHISHLFFSVSTVEFEHVNVCWNRPFSSTFFNSVLSCSISAHCCFPIPVYFFVFCLYRKDAICKVERLKWRMIYFIKGNKKVVHWTNWYSERCHIFVLEDYYRRQILFGRPYKIKS